MTHPGRAAPVTTGRPARPAPGSTAPHSARSPSGPPGPTQMGAALRLATSVCGPELRQNPCWPVLAVWPHALAETG